jgi:uncharacterized protein (TIGR03067 family)
MFMIQYRAILIVIAATLSGDPSAADETVDKIDDSLLAKLQGEWSPVSSVFDGKPFSSDAGKTTAVFQGRTMSIRIGNKRAGRLEIKHLVAENGVGHIDYEIVDAAGKRIRTRQLFELDGDKLTTCVRSPPGERPQELTSKPGSKLLLTVLQRMEKTTQRSNNIGDGP